MDNREWEEGASEPSFYSQQSIEQSRRFRCILFSYSEKRSQRQRKVNFNNILSLTSLEQRLSNPGNY